MSSSDCKNNPPALSCWRKLDVQLQRFLLRSGLNSKTDWSNSSHWISKIKTWNFFFKLPKLLLHYLHKNFWLVLGNKDQCFHSCWRSNICSFQYVVMILKRSYHQSSYHKRVNMVSVIKEFETFFKISCWNISNDGNYKLNPVKTLLLLKI